MLKITSRTTLSALGVVCMLALASPASAQKSKSSSKSSVRRSSPTRVSSGSVKSSSKSSVRKSSTVSRKVNSKSPTIRRKSTGNVRNTVRVYRKSNDVITGKTNNVKSGATRKVYNGSTKIYKVGSQKSANVKGGNSAVTFTRDGRTALEAKTGTTRGIDREGYGNTFRVREPLDRSVNEPAVHHAGYRPNTRHGYGYGYGHTYGYYRGYHRGYHAGYHHGYYYGHSHYYGPSLVFGFHYGGFGFYSGYWHFAIVIGSPIHVYRPYYYYYPYTWWNGRGSSLYSWDNAVEAYPADYSFDASSCIELWIATNDDTDYQIQINPAYWNARDPGELYAALWSELDQNGRLEIEDQNGVIHVFPAGMIRQIEARGCR